VIQIPYSHGTVKGHFLKRDMGIKCRDNTKVAVMAIRLFAKSLSTLFSVLVPHRLRPSFHLHPSCHFYAPSRGGLDWILLRQSPTEKWSKTNVVFSLNASVKWWQLERFSGCSCKCTNLCYVCRTAYVGLDSESHVQWSLWITIFLLLMYNNMTWGLCSNRIVKLHGQL